MRLVIVALVFAAMQSVAANAQPEPKPSLRLVLSPDRVEATSGHEFILNLQMTNLSKQAVSCTVLQSFNLDAMYSYDIRRDDGKPLEFLHPNAGIVVRLGRCRVEPNETANETIGTLMSSFGMQEPGVYTVQVLRRDPDDSDKWDKSNMVRVEVKEPQ